MEQVFTHAKPVWGSCNGLQLAAVVLGGSVAASPNGIEIGLAKDMMKTTDGQAHPMLAAREEGNRDDWEKHTPRLREFGPGELVIEDPDDICGRDIGKHRFVLDLNFRTWELDSSVARPRLGIVSTAV